MQSICQCIQLGAHVLSQGVTFSKKNAIPLLSIKQKGEAVYSLGGIYVLQNLNKKVVPQIRTNDSK